MFFVSCLINKIVCLFFDRFYFELQCDCIQIMQMHNKINVSLIKIFYSLKILNF